MRKFMVMIILVSMVILATGCKAKEVKAEKADKSTKAKVEETEKLEDEKIVEMFVDDMNQMDRTKAYKTETDNGICAVVITYHEDGRTTKEYYSIDEITNRVTEEL